MRIRRRKRSVVPWLVATTKQIVAINETRWL
jgi:hypothetical protein